MMRDMEANETTHQSSGNGKRGIVIALVALVVVLALAFFAYDALAANAREEQLAVAKEQTQAAEHDPELPRLVDFNATVYTETGEPFTLDQIAQGKPFVMNFWATWCPYCIQEMDDYQKLYDEYKDRVSFAFIDIADGQRETVEMGAAWMQDNGHDLPTYYDTKLEAMYAYGATNLPTTVVVAANGDIMDVSVGVISLQRMRDALDSLLES